MPQIGVYPRAMPQLSWLGTIIATSVAVLLAMAGGKAILARLVERAVQHGLDQRLESWKAALRADEERLKATLRATEEQVAALRSGALSGLADRQATLMRRRIEAVDKVWSETNSLQRYILLVLMTPLIRNALASEKVTETEVKNYKKFAELILQSAGMTDASVFPPDGAASERLYLDPLTWSIYSTYRIWVMIPVMQLLMIKAGAGDALKDLKPHLDSLKTILPEHTDAIVRGDMFSLMAPLQEKLFAQLQLNLEGKHSDADAVRRAADILADARAMEQQLTPPGPTPPMPAQA
jgi:hypothetical protein